MEELSFDNILGEQEIETLFTAPEETEETSGDGGAHESGDDSKNPESDEEKTTEVVDSETLFEEENSKPESVGSEKNKEVREKEDTIPDEGEGTSPKTSTLPLPTLRQRMESSLTLTMRPLRK